MDVAALLGDSFVCRLCAEENKNGTDLFPATDGDQDLSQLVNKYLPIKIEKNEKLPSKICPGCNIQLEATKSFLDLVVEGQSKLRQLVKNQQETLKRQEKQKQQLEVALKNVNPNSSVQTYAIHTDETGEKFLIQIITDGPLFPPDHELSLRMEGVEKPRKKRGRPPKPPGEEQKGTVETVEQNKKEQQEDEEDELDAEGRRKRRIKVPARFLEAVQGKELDRIFKEEGVTDDECSDSEKKMNVNKGPLNFDEIIGHMQSGDGEDLGELVVVTKAVNKPKLKGRLLSSATKKRKKIECEICGRTFLHYGRYEVHKTFHTNVKYRCGEITCHLKAESKEEIQQHHATSGHKDFTVVEDVEEYGEVQQPKIEDVKTLNEEEVEIKDVVTSGEMEQTAHTKKAQSYMCGVCDKKFSCKQNYEVHYKAVHENQRPYKCEKCDKSFSYLNSLKCHMLKHSDKSEKPYTCGMCDKSFNHPSSLVYHKEAEHNNGRKFVCNKCGKSFKHKQLLQRHQLVHSEDRPHVCNICNATFKTRANLLNHLPVHTGIKKYNCTQCPQSFAHKTSLTLHLRWHSGQKPYQCDVCQKSFSQKGNLAEHKRIHTGEKPYCCDHCGRKFTTSSQFKLHVKRHTGERPWRCEYCSKTFLHKDTWKCHTRRHRDERPFKCTVCNRGFTEQWALKKHERLHSGEKPYACNVCDKSFADCSNLTKHKKIHYGKLNIKNNLITNDYSEGSDNQVLYLSYEQSADVDSQAFVQIMNPLDPLSTDNGDIQGSPLQNCLYPGIAEDLQKTSIDELDQAIQLQQIIDQDGNALSLTTTDGQQIKVVTTVKEGQQNIQGLMPDGTLIPINLSVQDGKPVVQEIFPDLNLKDVKEIEDKPKIDESGDSAFASTMLDNNAQFLTKFDSNIQFLTEDGQNVCLITSYNGEDTINPQYLTMA